MLTRLCNLLIKLKSNFGSDLVMAFIDFKAIAQEIIKDMEKNVNSVVQRYGETAREKVDTLSHKAVETYYSGYSPRRYGRTDKLYDSYKTFNNSGGHRLSVSTRFSSDALEGHASSSPYHQDGGAWVPWHPREYGRSYADGTPEADWIFERFWAGEHPIYYWNGNGYSDATVTSERPEDQLDNDLEQYANELADKIANEIII